MNANNLTYTRVGDYLVPDLGLPPQPEGTLNRWGRARKQFLMEHKKALHMHMMTQLTLWPHLLETQEMAAARFDLLTAQMAEAKGVTEALKASDQMAWLGLMNNIRHSAEESVRQELIDIADRMQCGYFTGNIVIMTNRRTLINCQQKGLRSALCCSAAMAMRMRSGRWQRVPGMCGCFEL